MNYPVDNVGVSTNYLNLQLPGVPEGETTMIRYDQFVAKLFKEESFKEMALHAALGICGEAGELGDAIKKHVVYNKPVDRDNIVEELGDLRFYIQAVQNLYGISDTELLQTNGYKLAKRYAGLNYSDAAANARADKVDTGNTVRDTLNDRYKQQPAKLEQHRVWSETKQMWIHAPGREAQ